jgi:hypothetical protein
MYDTRYQVPGRLAATETVQYMYVDGVAQATYGTTVGQHTQSWNHSIFVNFIGKIHYCNFKYCTRVRVLNLTLTGTDWNDGMTIF